MEKIKCLKAINFTLYSCTKDEARTWFSAAKEAASEVLALKYFLKCSGSEFGSIPRVSESES